MHPLDRRRLLEAFDEHALLVHEVQYVIDRTVFPRSIHPVFDCQHHESAIEKKLILQLLELGLIPLRDVFGLLTTDSAGIVRRDLRKIDDLAPRYNRRSKPFEIPGIETFKNLAQHDLGVASLDAGRDL